jgi:hypothetical protein
MDVTTVNPQTLDGDVRIHIMRRAAAPFCAVPSNFRVRSKAVTYSAICIWDALGIAAALHQDATINAGCGDCGDPMKLEVKKNALARGEGVIHFAVPARNWWDNIGYT